MDTYLILQYDNRPIQHNLKKLMNMNKQYCLQYKYDYKFIHKEYNLPPYWIKVLLTYTLLPKYKGILWLDTDACIYNDTIQLTDMIMKDKHFYSSPDNKVWDSPFNAGVFFVLNTKKGLEIMNHWLNTYDEKMWKKQDKKWTASCDWASECYEQGSFVKNILPKYSTYIHSFPWRFFQSFYHNLEEDNSCVFTLHFTGVLDEIRTFLKKKKKKNCTLKTRKKS